MSNIQFTVTLYRTVRAATFTAHDGTPGTDVSLPVGSPVAIDVDGNVFVCREEYRDMFKGTIRKQGVTRKLFRDHWQYHNINAFDRDNAGPHWQAALNAIPL